MTTSVPGASSSRNRSNGRRRSRFRATIRPVRFATATSNTSFARSIATVVASMSASSWLWLGDHVHHGRFCREKTGRSPCHHDLSLPRSLSPLVEEAKERGRRLGGCLCGLIASLIRDGQHREVAGWSDEDGAVIHGVAAAVLKYRAPRPVL